jgi:hypothetical protein
MVRVPRVEFDGALYHLLCCGDRRKAIFLDDKDRKSSLRPSGHVSRLCSRIDDLANQPQVSKYLKEIAARARQE